METRHRRAEGQEKPFLPADRAHSAVPVGAHHSKSQVKEAFLSGV